MMLRFALQVTLLASTYNFGTGQESRRVRIFLDENERLLLPSDSKIQILNPLVYYNENYRKAPPKVFNKPLKFGKKPSFFTPEDLEVFKGFTSVGLTTACCDENVNQEEVIHPVTLGGVSSTSGGRFHASEEVKPVEEHIEDDIKYDFRTRTHSVS